MIEAEFLELPARERDALVAEKVMGLPIGACRNLYWDTTDQSKSPWTNGRQAKHILRYTTTWEGMGMVVEKMRELKGAPFSAVYWRPDEPHGWAAEFGGNKHAHPDDLWGEAEADTAPLAVALAALKALGVVE
jgi:hypothetical protein